MASDTQSISQRLSQLSGEEKRISCSEARRLAEESGVEYRVVGRLCDGLGIKIHGCELGCF